MSRRAQAPKRTILPDPRFNSEMLAKFMNMIMISGKKSAAEHILYGAIDTIADRKKIPAEEAVSVLETALDNVKPAVEVKSRRVGGATYQVPVEVSPKRQISLAIRWIRDAATGRKGRPMYQRLAAELIDAYHREGSAMTVRENTHRMAEANKAFAHFAW